MQVTLLGTMGDDLRVTNAARVSFGKHKKEFDDDDARLIRYLGEHGHYSPFGHCFVSFHVKAPIFVARQLVKHKFLRWSEVSRRYVDSEPEFYEPYSWRGRAKNKKQGSEGEVDHGSVSDASLYAKLQYEELLEAGVCPEQARMVLPLNTYTEWYWSGSLDAFANMYNLRSTGDTQVETYEVAESIGDYLLDRFPHSWEALTEE